MCKTKKSVTLQRFCYSPDGTFGNLILPSGIVLASVERPWLNNLPMVSCIPEGRYECSPRVFYRKGYDAVEIKEVPDRSHILFHIANFVSELKGCVGVNSRFGAIGHEWCGVGSTKAFKQFMSEVGQDNFSLTITNIVGDKI